LPDAEALTVFLAAAIALNLTPGPDMLYVAGLVSALGIAAGCLRSRERGARWLQRLTGAVFVGLGTAARAGRPAMRR